MTKKPKRLVSRETSIDSCCSSSSSTTTRRSRSKKSKSQKIKHHHHETLDDIADETILSTSGSNSNITPPNSKSSSPISSNNNNHRHLHHHHVHESSSSTSSSSSSSSFSIITFLWVRICGKRIKWVFTSIVTLLILTQYIHSLIYLLPSISSFEENDETNRVANEGGEGGGGDLRGKRRKQGLGDYPRIWYEVDDADDDDQNRIKKEGIRTVSNDVITIILSGNSKEMNKTKSSTSFIQRKKIRLNRSIPQYPSPQSDITQLYPILDSNDMMNISSYNNNNTLALFHDNTTVKKIKMKMRIFPNHTSNPDCRPMSEWQVTFYPTCNMFHEGLGNMKEGLVREVLGGIGKGSWRDAWVVNGDKEERVVLKTWRYTHNMEDEYFELNRVDAVSMERLTSSPFVLNIHGLCGLSLITEYIPPTKPSSLSRLADKSKPFDKVRLMKHVVQGLVHIHSISRGEKEKKEGVVSLVHNDVNTDHILLGKGNRPTYFDFNIAQFMMWDVVRDLPCHISRCDYFSPQWRSPEEQRSYDNLTHHPLTEKVDIYALGNICFRFATGERAWRSGHGSITPQYLAEVAKLKHNGTMPPLPESFRENEEGGIGVLLRLMRMCYRFDPTERPTAKEIVRFLEKELMKLKRVGEGKKEKKKKPK